jgi:hypothetical protein
MAGFEYKRIFFTKTKDGHYSTNYHGNKFVFATEQIAIDWVDWLYGKGLVDEINLNNSCGCWICSLVSSSKKHVVNI